MSRQQKSKTAPAPSRRGRSKTTLTQTNSSGLLDQPARLNRSRKAHAEAGEKKTAASASTEGKSAAQETKDSSAAKSNGRLGRRKRRRKQVRLSVAMRKIGLDEYMVAESLAGLIENLGTNRGEAKVLLDVLKESTRFLEPPPKEHDTNESGGQNGVVLRHDVPRPARNAVQGEDATEPGAG